MLRGDKAIAAINEPERTIDLERLKRHDATGADAALVIERLQLMLRMFANRLETQAFEIPPPNKHTPYLVSLANEMREAANL